MLEAPNRNTPVNDHPHGFENLRLVRPRNRTEVRWLPGPINPPEVLGKEEHNSPIPHRESLPMNQAIRWRFIYYQDSDYKCVVAVILLKPDR